MNEMGRCRDCCWWDCYTESRDCGECLLAETNGNDGTPHPQSKAHASDTENYHASLLTDADFGCVQFEAKS